MKLYLALALAGSSLMAAAQVDCADGRYNNYAFAPGVTRTQAVTFGSNTAVGGGSQTLKMDIYEPQGDSFAERPMVFVAFGGSFLSGTRNDGYVVDLCNRYARMGFVAVAIDYRVGFFLPNQVNTTLAVMRSMHDYRAAIRWFRKSAGEGNPYRIDTERIYVGGVSAGAIAAIHTAYLNKLSEVPAYMANDTAGLGGVEGNSGNPGYPSHVNGVFSLSGTIGDTTWIEPDDVPILSIHETGDNVVPIGTQMVSVSGLPTGLVASGSRDIHRRANNLGIPNCFREINQNQHVGYLNYAYNESVGYLASYLEDLACGQAIECEENTYIPGTGITDNLNHRITVGPNPTSEKINIDLTGVFQQGLGFDVVDVTGRTILSGAITSTRTIVDVSELNAGIYTIVVYGAEGRGSQRFVKH